MTNDPKTSQTMALGEPGSPERARYITSFDRQYHPPEVGIHVCGFNEDLPHGPHFTVLALPMNPEAARSAFQIAKQKFAVSAEEGDVLVDLIIEPDIEDDFWMRRQMVEPMQRGMASDAA